jgi:hypothetical protein
VAGGKELSLLMTGGDLPDDELADRLRTAARGDTKAADSFFSAFPYCKELSAGRYLAAFNHGISLLLKCQALDNDAYDKIHKGTPFYWLGTASFLLHDCQTAVFFYDAAVAEDLKAGVNPATGSTPALLFIQINSNQPNQAARDLVQLAQARVEDAIKKYNNMPNVPDLSMAKLRGSFLRPAVSPDHKNWRSLATAFISFFLEWNHNRTLLDLRIGDGTVEPFFIHLFKGCVLFESLLKANPKQSILGDETLGSVLQKLHGQLGIPHDVKIGGVEFHAILSDLQNADNRIQTAIEYTGKIRNAVGHYFGWKDNEGNKDNLDKKQYDHLSQMVAVSCLHAIACLYR